MVDFTVDGIRKLMDRPTNIRNVSIIGQVDHGKSILADIMVSRLGIVPPLRAAEPGQSDSQDDKKEPDGLVKPIVTPIYGMIDQERLLVVASKQETNGNEFLINLIDTPGNVDLSSEVAASLRVTDGAVIVVDYVEGIGQHTEEVLRQALREGVKPVIVINKIDHAFSELGANHESLYLSFQHIIGTANGIISTHGGEALSDARVSPEKGTVIFGSALQGWCFSLGHFAIRYAKKYNVDVDKMTTKLWGDNFFNPTTKKWTTRPTGKDNEPLERAFNMFVLDPISAIYRASMNLKQDKISRILEQLQVELPPQERCLEGVSLIKAIMGRFSPACDSLEDMIISTLPSPVMAQKYRVKALYEGPINDESGTGIHDCDPKGPLVVYVSRMVATLDKGRFYAFGRVFSGTVSSGLKVRIQGASYIPGRKHDLFVRSIERTVIMMGSHVELVEDCPAGNIVGLVGIDQFLLKSGTITTSDTTYNLKEMRSSTCPIVQVAVEVEKTEDLPALVESLKWLSKSDPDIHTWISEVGEHIISSASEHHLNICLKGLEEDHTSIPLKISQPFVTYRESVKTESSIVARSKSANKHTRLYAKALPMDDELTKAIEDGEITARDNFKARADVLADRFGWEVTHARKIWGFGPDTTGPNLLVDITKGVQYMNEIKDSCYAGFQWATKEGVCCEESMRGVRFNILDATLFSDAIHRGGGQIMPAMRRVCYAACLLATPSLQEPVYLVEVQCPENTIDVISRILKERRGEVINQEQYLGNSKSKIVAYLPVAESFNLDRELRIATTDQVLTQCVFDRWEVLPGSPLEKGSKAEEIALMVRKRKGLKPEIPPLETYYHKL